MVYFTDSKLVNFEDLERLVDEDGNRVYSERLIEGIQGGNLNYLYEIDAEKRNNKFFMEPLLYAVKHNSRFSSYEVYKYYGEELQKSDLEIATEIVINEPDVFEHTAIADDPTSVIYLAKINPEIILYMSEDLKSDGNFIEELCETGNKEAIMYAARECNISDVLQDNPELANNPEFIKEACKANTETINYIAQHTQEFSAEALQASEEVLIENVNNKSNQSFSERHAKITEKIEMAKIDENPDKEYIEKLENDKKRYERHMNKNVFTSQDIEAMKSGDTKLVHKAKMMLKVIKDWDPEIREDVENAVKIGEAVIAKQKEEKDNKISPQDIEKLSENSKLSEVQAEPNAIREEITSQREQQTTKENQEIGEM